MADLFVSYTHADRERVRPLVNLLEEEGWTVWWDRGIEPGKRWEKEIDREIAISKSILVVWTSGCKNSEWVHYETDIAIEREMYIPVLLDEDSIPEKYTRYQATELTRWKGNSDLSELQSLIRGIEKMVKPSRIDTVRPGYDKNFLDDHTIKLPDVTGSAAVLRYKHFTTVLNPARRLAYYSAYNMDGLQSKKVKRLNDRFITDPLIQKSLQLSMQLATRSGYDRGHLMSRSHVCWGEQREAEIAAKQAFYMPNISLQLPSFNRVYWLKLEDLERKIASDHGKLVGFSGPVFLAKDVSFRGDFELEDGLIARETFRIPRKYWKVIVFKNSEQLAYTAFLMDQDEMEKKKITRDFDLKRYMVSIADLERTTKLTFDPILKEAVIVDDIKGYFG